MHNWRRYPSSNWYYKLTKNAVRNLAVCCGAIWRHREKLQYRCTTTVHPVPIQLLKKDFGKFISCRTFVAHKLVHSEPFLDYLYDVWHLLSALYIATCGKIFLYKLVHIYIFRPKQLRWNFLWSSQLYEVVRTNLSADFWTFRNFWIACYVCHKHYGLSIEKIANFQFCKNCGAI